MTRAGLEPATYGLKERMIIGVLASLNSAKSMGEPLRGPQVIVGRWLESSKIGQYGVFWGSYHNALQGYAMRALLHADQGVFRNSVRTVPRPRGGFRGTTIRTSDRVR